MDRSFIVNIDIGADDEFAVFQERKGREVIGLDSPAILLTLSLQNFAFWLGRHQSEGGDDNPFACGFHTFENVWQHIVAERQPLGTNCLAYINQVEVRLVGHLEIEVAPVGFRPVEQAGAKGQFIVLHCVSPLGVSAKSSGKSLWCFSALQSSEPAEHQDQCFCLPRRRQQPGGSS